MLVSPCNEAESAEQAYTAIHRQRPELILMDWMLPGMSGIELVKRLQRDGNTQDIPVIMLTARNEEADRISGFQAGIDDYISKPFSPAELVVRIQAVLRRTRHSQPAEMLEFAGLTLDPLSHRVTADGTRTRLWPHRIPLAEILHATPRPRIQP